VFLPLLLGVGIVKSRVLSVDYVLSNYCEEIGITTSGASTNQVPLQLFKKAENKVFDEDIVLIRDVNLDELLVLGVIRRITKFEPIVKDRVRSPFIDKPEILDQTILLPFTSGIAKLYATLNFKTRQIEEVRHVVTPGSKVYVVRRGDFLKDFVKVSKAIFVGKHRFSGWDVPIDTSFINYHVGVFGATGMGKSRLIKLMINELVRIGHKVIVFDHSGVDYVPYFKDYVISSKMIKISPPTIASVIAEKARLHWQTFGEYLEIACITFVTGARIASKRIVRNEQTLKWSKQEFTTHLGNVMRSLNARDSTIEKAKLFINYFIEDEFFQELNHRTLEAVDIVNKALNDGLVVIDLSEDTELPVKQGIIRDIIEEAWKITKQYRQTLNVIFIIDEAQNYVPEREWTICGDIIETTAREGRKWGLSLILASQRVTNDVRTSVRANLGTIFFSKLSAQGDLREIGTYLDLADVNESILAQLSVREFFVCGLMNPLRKPILIKVREVS